MTARPTHVVTWMRVVPALVVLALAHGARAESRRELPAELVREVTARATERGVPPALVLAPISEAAVGGVPPELVATKVLEGLSKGVPPSRIAAVAHDLAGRLTAADGVLREAQGMGLPAAVDRRAALSDLATALAGGVSSQDLAGLARAARGGRQGTSEGVVSAAHAVGELARRGVPPADAMPLGLAIARHGARPPGEIVAVFEEWRAEGGKDARAFVAEAAARVDRGQGLDGMVDVFGESADRLNPGRGRGKDKERDQDDVAGRDVGKNGSGKGNGPGERADKAGGPVPGVEDFIKGKGNGKGNPNPGPKDKKK